MTQKHSTESLKSANKETLIAHVLELQNQLPTEYRVIPAVPAVPEIPAFTDDKGIKHDAVPAVPAVPAVTITDQLLATTPQGLSYTAACKEVDAANERAKSEFDSNPKVGEYNKAMEVINQVRNTPEFKALDELNAKLKAELAPKNANMRAIIKKFNPLIDAAENAVKFPENFAYLLEVEAAGVPTYTPTAYPPMGQFFPNGISGNFPPEFLLGSRKNPSAPATARTPKVSSDAYPTSGQFKYLKATATATATGIDINVGSEVSPTQVASCPASIVTLYNANVSNGSIVAGKVVKAISTSWSAGACLVSGSSKAGSVWSAS